MKLNREMLYKGRGLREFWFRGVVVVVVVVKKLTECHARVLYRFIPSLGKTTQKKMFFSRREVVFNVILLLLS